jgi:putative transposase
VSFSNESDVPEANDEEAAAWLATFGKDELTGRAVGIDRGVAPRLQCSNGTGFNLSETQRERIARKQAAARRWQKKLSRRAKGSANRRKGARRIAQLRRYEADVRRDFAHQSSHAIVADTRTSLIVFEALDVQRMTRKPKPRQDERGRWLRNGARAKAGINRNILGCAWSSTRDYCIYKARRAGKLVLDVATHYTSQACSHCGYTHPDNRSSQAVFVCQRCGHSENADINASRSIRNRGVERILSGEFRPKGAKRIRRMRQKTTVGAGRPESKSVETMVSHRADSSAAHGSRKQRGDGAILAETHASRAMGA